MRKQVNTKKLDIIFHNPNSQKETEKMLIDFLAEFILDDIVQNLESINNTYAKYKKPLNI